jgi:hypothetical protein
MKTASALSLCLMLAAPAFGAETPAPAPQPGIAQPGIAQPGTAEPGRSIAGFVSPMQGIGICMDGATHLIHSPQGDYRLKAANPEAAKALARVANGKERVTLVGHVVHGPECIYFSVESVIRLMRD